MQETEIKNIKYHVIVENNKPTCRLSWVGARIKLNKDDTTHKIPTDKMVCETIDFPNPDNLYKAKDALIRAIKNKFPPPLVSIRPKVGENELLIDGD